MTRTGNRAFQLFVLWAVCFRLAAMGAEDIWHGETLWLQGSTGGWGGSLLFGFLMQAWSLISRNEVWLRLIPFAFSVGAAITIYLLARRAFNRLGSMEAGILAAVSPLLCTGAWEIHPVTAEVFIGSLWLLAFLRLLDGKVGMDLVLHGATAAAAVAVNPLMALFAPAQLAVLVLYHGHQKKLLLKWLLSLCVATLVMVVILAATPESMDLPAEPGALSAYDVGFLFTDISMGRLFAWSPPTPPLTFAPSGFEDPATQGRTASSLEDGFLPWFLQRMQLLFLGCFCMVAVIGCLAVWGIRTRAIPGGGRSRSSIPKENAQAREGAALFLLCIFFPLLYAICFPTALPTCFPEQRLLFLVVPFLVLVGRGFTRLQLAAVRYALIILLAGISFLYVFSTLSLKDAVSGISIPMAQVQQELREGDIAVMAPFFQGPASWYSDIEINRGGDLTQADGRVWLIKFSPEEQSAGEGLNVFLRRCGYKINAVDKEAYLAARSQDFEMREWRLGTYRVELWTQLQAKFPGADEGR